MSGDWCQTPIDCFILSRLEAAGLRPFPQADRNTLIRRLTFDLTGLPPTVAERQRFVDDARPDAYERLVDRLLASKSYGERWAQHWLDLARFAETDGFEHDKIRPNAWRYRDWVIQALNADMPFDEFLTRQLAADEMHPDDPSAAIATGFLLCGPDMPDINSQLERRHNFLNDMTGTVGSVFLGLQFGCAQCHDHKFDPISQADFYRLRAYFEHAELFREQSVATRSFVKRAKSNESKRLRDWKAAEGELNAIRANVLKRVRAAKQKPKLVLADREFKQHFSKLERTRVDELTAQLKRLREVEQAEAPLGRVLRAHSGSRQPSYLWVRGDFRRKGTEVKPAFPRIAVNEDQPRSRDQSSARADLAHWMSSSTNPLTTRVIVNRIWQHHFGRGLSVSESDFGIMGDEPTHPELLDWLATELPRLDWSLKALHRLIVVSAVYRQTSAPIFDSIDGNSIDVPPQFSDAMRADPKNDLLWKMRRRRLEGETIRDAMLAASGRLNQFAGGPGIRPTLPPELVVTLLRNQWPVTADKEQHNRRSIYLFVRRNLRYPLFEAFDKPDTNLSCARRNRSTTAPQSLILLNSAATLDAAKGLANLIIRSAPRSRSQQVEVAFLKTLGRPPRADELTSSVAFLESTIGKLQAASPTQKTRQLASPTEAETAALVDLARVLFNLNEFVYTD